MKFDTNESKALVQRIRKQTGQNVTPPAQALHALMMLATTTPEHLLAAYQEQNGSILDPDGDDARWTLLALTDGMLTVVEATGRGERTWTLESTSKAGTVPKTFDAVSFPVHNVIAVRVTDVKSERHDGFELEVARATWALETASRTIELPNPEEHKATSQAETFAEAVGSAIAAVRK